MTGPFPGPALFPGAGLYPGTAAAAGDVPEISYPPGESRSWRFLMQRITGAGLGDYPTELPFLADVVITERLSGPPQITATVPIEVSQMRDADGRPALMEWGTAIYAEDPNGEVFGAILVDSSFDGPKWELDCAGFSYFPKDQPWPWEDSWVQVDPLEVHRVILDRLQTLPYGDYDVDVDVVSSPVRIGNPPPAEGQTGDGPFTMNWFETLDCGAVIDKLATETPFDWIERHYWDGDRIRHRIQVGYPRIGRRRNDLRFGIGENVAVLPTATRSGADYASSVLMLGQGEGRARIAGDVAVYTGRPRRVKVIDDKTVTTRDQAVEAARREQAWRTGPVEVAELELINHPNAPIGQVRQALGDEVWLEGWTGWVDLAMWVRIVAVSISPAKSDRIVITVQRADVGV